jgi:acetyltransferase-like isoleucine patch superfamily enzyme
MIHRFVEKVIQSLKHDATYKLDPALTGRVLFQVASYRFATMLRGYWRGLRLRESRGAIFVGKRVTLRNPQMISAGRSVVIEDSVTIDALSKWGVILGDNVTIAKFTTIQCTGVIRSIGFGLRIGSNSAVGAYSFIGAQGGIKIGNDVIMGPRVSFHAENHKYDDSQKPIRLLVLKSAQVASSLPAVLSQKMCPPIQLLPDLQHALSNIEIIWMAM